VAGNTQKEKDSEKGNEIFFKKDWREGDTKNELDVMMPGEIHPIQSHRENNRNKNQLINEEGERSLSPVNFTERNH